MPDKAFQGTGWKFPIRTDSAGKIAFSRGEEDIKEAIYIIVKTARGERMMRPEFGCGANELVFDPLNPVTLATIEAHVRESLITFEPRIDLVSVVVEANKDQEGQLSVSIDYHIRDTNNADNLVFDFYLKGRG